MQICNIRYKSLIMKKILVTTDFSKHSKAGLRFAIQLATQMEVELLFYHCFQALIPTTIYRERVENSLQEQSAAKLKQLEKFVADTHRAMKVTPGVYRCVVEENLNPGKAILAYTAENGVDYICISTRGAGGLGKIIGTHTSSVMHHSPVPVLAVPDSWRTRNIKKVLYASDLENLEEEMHTVCKLARLLEIKADMAHFFYLNELKPDAKTLKALWRRQFDCLDRIYLERLDGNFAVQLDHLINKVKPSIVVFFTHTNQNWFDRIFAASRSEAFSFITKAPMLVYRKGRVKGQ